MNTLSQPIVWGPVLGFVIALLAFLGSFQSRGLTRGALILAAMTSAMLSSYLLVAVFAPNLIDARIRTYWAFYDAIEIGMTHQDVMDVMDLHYPESGGRQKPTITEDSNQYMGFFMNPEDRGGPNCEGVFLDFADGKATGKRYSRD
jgi:hypothetical protein